LQGKIKGHQVRTEETIEQWLQNLYSNKPRFTKKFSSRFYKLKHGKIVPFIAASTEEVKASFFQKPEYLPISLKMDYDSR
jgi:catalase (peroxidase I)